MVRAGKRSTSQSTTIVPFVGPGETAIDLKINGQTHRLEFEPRRSLLDVLRDDLGLTGAKKVCNLGECGACTVLVDGRPMYACLTLGSVALIPLA